MRKLTFIIFILLYTNVFTQSIEWDKPIRAGTQCNSLTIDSYNNFYFAGEINTEGRQQTYFGIDSLPYYNQFFNYGFIAKTDTNYQTKWIKIIECDRFYDPIIRIDKEDNLVLTAKIKAPLKIDSLELDLPLNENLILIAKFSSEGNLLWHNFIKGYSLFIRVNDLKIDENNDIYIAGDDSGPVNFFNNNVIDTITESLYQQFFFAKYTSDGQFTWVKSLPQGYSQNGIYAIEVDRKQNIYLTGWWYQGGTFDSIPKATNTLDIYFAKYNSNQKLQWLKQFKLPNGSIFESGYSLALDENINSIYITGNFVGTADFGGQILQSNDHNIFLARYSLEGELIWVKNMGSWSGAASYTEEGTKVYVDNEGFVYLVGTIGKNGNFDGVIISAHDDTSNSNLWFDSFIAKYKATGELIWVTHAGHPDNDDRIYDLLKDNNNNFFAVGHTFTNSIFGDYVLEDDDALMLGFICKLFDEPITFLDVSKPNLTFTGDSSVTESFEIVSNLNWQLSMDTTWVTTNLLSGYGNQIINVYVDRNPSVQTRNSTIKVISAENTEKLVNITQYGFLNVGIKEVTDNDHKFIIYPNPASNIIKFESNYDFINANITIFDNKGQIFLQKLNTDNQVNIKHLDNGVYILLIKNSKNQIARKFIKK